MPASKNGPAERIITSIMQTLIDVEGSPYTVECLKRLIEYSYGDACEAEELKIFRTLLVGCDRFIDVGANVGQYTYNASVIMNGGEIVSIEANPYLIPVLDALATNINVQCTNEGENTVVVVDAAITDTEGPVKFWVSSYAPKSSMVSNCENGKEVMVPGVPLDNFYSTSTKTLIKMDIEGAEYRALCSAERFLSSNHTQFLVEVHGWGDASINKYPLHVCNLFRKKGYAMHHIGYRVRNHYFFYKAGLIERSLSYFLVLPRVGFMSLAYRYATPVIPIMRWLRARVYGAR